MWWTVVVNYAGKVQRFCSQTTVGLQRGAVGFNTGKAVLNPVVPPVHRFYTGNGSILAAEHVTDSTCRLPLK